MRLGLVTDALLFTVCAWVLASDVSEALTGDVRPSARAGALLLNLTAAFVVVHRGFALLQRVVAGPDVRRMLGIAKWVLAMTVPLPAAGYVEKLMHRAHRVNIDALAAEVDARTARAITARGTVRAEDLEGLEGPYLRALTVRSDTGAFLLEVSLPAIDIDGFTGRYSSTEGRWRVHHNDEPAAPDPEFDAAGPTISCRLESKALRCVAR